MIKVLAIETSCDETSVSVVSNSEDIYKIHSNIVASQIKDHSKWGGVVPELAARKHLELIPLVLEQNIPVSLEKENKNLCVVGLFADPTRLSEIRKTRANVNQTIDLKSYTDVEKIKVEVENSKKLFKKFNWPSIDVTRRSVEETAASIIKIFEIKKEK